MHTVIQQYNPAAQRGPKAAAVEGSGGLLMLEGGGAGGSPGARARNRRDMSLDAVVARARSRCEIQVVWGKPGHRLICPESRTPLPDGPLYLALSPSIVCPPAPRLKDARGGDLEVRSGLVSEIPVVRLDPTPLAVPEGGLAQLKIVASVSAGKVEGLVILVTYGDKLTALSP